MLGYAGEPYLRFVADGPGSSPRTAWSAATYENEPALRPSPRRRGSSISKAAPEWVTVGDGGVWAWHDHRSHWMDDEPLIGLDAGESLPSQNVPLVVDGERIDVEVRTTLQPLPSSWPAIFGVLIGLQVVLLGALAGPATATLSSLLLAAAATVVGVVQFRSLPSETGPLLSWWLLPTIALVCTIFTILTYGRWALLQSALALLTGAQLVLWAFTRRTTLTKAVLPTDLPYWFDRLVTGASLTGGAVLVVVSLLALRPVPPGATQRPNASSIARLRPS